MFPLLMCRLTDNLHLSLLTTALLLYTFPYVLILKISSHQAKKQHLHNDDDDAQKWH